MTEWNAQAYHQASALQQRVAAERLAPLHLEGGERVLDVGCGDGKITVEVAARLPSGSVLGIDQSRDMIAFANEHFGPQAHPNLRFEVADVRTLPYREEFDLVISFNALHWVHEQDAALRSLRRALKANGRALLQFVPEGDIPSFEDTMEVVRQRPAWAGFFPGFSRPHAHFTPEEYRVLAEQAGFRVEKLVPENRIWDFGSREPLAAFCTATFVAWVLKLPENQRSVFIADVLDYYRTVVADVCPQPHALQFYQMMVTLVAV